MKKGRIAPKVSLKALKDATKILDKEVAILERKYAEAGDSFKAEIGREIKALEIVKALISLN